MIPGEMILNSHPEERESTRGRKVNTKQIHQSLVEVDDQKIVCEQELRKHLLAHKNLKTSEWHDTITNWEHYLQISTSIPSTLLCTYKDQSGHNRFVIAVTLV